MYGSNSKNNGISHDCSIITIGPMKSIDKFLVLPVIMGLQ